MTHLFVDRSELMPIGETTEDHKRWKHEEAMVLETDRTNADRRTGGLFRGCFKHDHNRPVIRDMADGVTRCPICAWELEGGFCNSCQVAYGSDGEALSGEDMDYSDSDDSSASIYDFDSEEQGAGPDGSHDVDYLALLHNDDISLDGDGQSIHGYGDNFQGEFSIGRAAAQGLLDRPDGPRSPTAGRRYAPSMLSDVATNMDESQFHSGNSEEDDDEANSLNGFVVEDEDEGQAIQRRSTLYPSIDTDSDGGLEDDFMSHARQNFGMSSENDSQLSEDISDSSGNAGLLGDSDSMSEDSGSISTGRLRRQRNRSTFGTGSGDQQLPAPRITNPRLSTRNHRLQHRQTAQSQAHDHQHGNTNAIENLQRGPIEVPSESDSPISSRRSRKRRPVVADLSSNHDGRNSLPSHSFEGRRTFTTRFSSDDDSDSGFNEGIARQLSSSGSATIGRQSPATMRTTTKIHRRPKFLRSPVLVQSSPNRPNSRRSLDQHPYVSETAFSRPAISPDCLEWPESHQPVQPLMHTFGRGVNNHLGVRNRAIVIGQGSRGAVSPSGNASRPMAGTDERKRESNNDRRRQVKLNRRRWNQEQNALHNHLADPSRHLSSP